MQSAPTASYQESPAAAQGRGRPQHNVLLNLAAPVLELVLKLRTSAIPPSNDVRPVAEDLLRQLEQGANSMGISNRQVQAVKFALVAFVDETILNPAHDFPLRDMWEREPLQLIHFSEHLAGEKFFLRLDEAIKNIETDVDVVEVYYLCLLLGYKGKYNIYLLEEQLKQVIRNVAHQLRQVGRLKPNALSAHWLANDQPPPPRTPGIPMWVKIAVPALVGFVLVVYAVLYFLLRNEIQVAR